MRKVATEDITRESAVRPEPDRLVRTRRGAIYGSRSAESSPFAGPAERFFMESDVHGKDQQKHGETSSRVQSQRVHTPKEY